VFNSSEETRHARLSDTLEILESWDAWDDIAALAHHQQVRTDLLKYINDMHQTRDDDPDVRLLP
jgi:hypothetical protein